MRLGEPLWDSEPLQASKPLQAAPQSAPRASDQRLEDLLNRLDAPFSTTLLTLIDARGLTDAQVYKRANMSRQLFSKIRSDASYRPTKKTVLALAIALGLSLDETRDLLARAGFALSHASKSDVIVEYFIRRQDYDIFRINEALYAFDQPIL
jgi:transcriptional regulator with XRE-family HTH domain